MQRMFKRILIQIWFISACSLIAANRPNIIFILCDDLGPGHLGILWQNQRTSKQMFATPRLDTFAEEGMILTRHYCPAPICAPSRGSLLTGRHQGHCAIRNMTDTMYNPERPPGVDHFTGTDLVIEHIEKFWCPSFTSTDITGKKAFRFKEDKRKKSRK